MEEERKVYGVLVGKAEGKRPLRRPRRKCEDGIRMYLREIGLETVEWIQLVRYRDRWRALVNTAMNLRALAPRS
jgi:ribosome biogenesis protein Nip4